MKLISTVDSTCAYLMVFSRNSLDTDIAQCFSNIFLQQMADLMVGVRPPCVVFPAHCIRGIRAPRII